MKDYINENPQKVEELLSRLAVIIKKLHTINVIHGDLTTSNMMLQEGTQEIIMIDFGLASVSPSMEDKAVDLYLFEKAFIATHPQL